MSEPDDRVACIGDVHGWIDRLEALVAQLDPEEELWFTGDLVDRGPDSAAVVRQVRRWCEAGRARCVLGNHEYALVQAVGCPDRDIPAQPAMWEAWLAVYGAHETLASYGLGLGAGPADLRRAMGEDLVWLASLPWISEASRRHAGAEWRLILVHAGLGPGPLADERAAIHAAAAQWWQTPHSYPPPLYDKSLVLVVPCDLPPRHLIISGHTPQSQPLVRRERIVCDTSGGRPGRPLSAVRWPSGEVLQAT